MIRTWTSQPIRNTKGVSRKGASYSRRQRRQSKRLQQRRQRHRLGRFWNWARGIAFFFVAYGFGAYLDWWGPFWPTSPVIELGAPSFSEPLQIPFFIENKSAIFDFENINFACSADVTVSEDMNYFVIGAPNAGATVGARSRRPFRCGGASNPPPRRLSLSFGLDYEVNLLVMRWKRREEIGPFVWHPELQPPQWIEGEML